MANSFKIGEKDFYINDTLKRSELVKMGVDKQRDIFRSSSPKIKASLYRFKIKTDIRDDKTLTKADKKILKEIYRHIKPEIYISPKDKREVDFRRYVEDQIEILRWNEEKRYKYLETIMTVSEYNCIQKQENNQQNSKL